MSDQNNCNENILSVLSNAYFLCSKFVSRLTTYCCCCSNPRFNKHFRDMFAIDHLVQYDDDEEIYNTTDSIIIRADLFSKIGRSCICIIHEHYLDFFSESKCAKNERHVYSTPLHLAAVRNQHLPSVEELLNSPDTNKDATNNFHETTLLLALKEHVNQNVIDTLLKYNCDTTIGCNRGVTPLHIAAFKNNVDLIQKCIQNGANVNAVTNNGVTPLQLAVLGSNYEAVKELLANKALTETASNFGFTPLMLALSYKDIDIRICEILCKFNINEDTPSGSPIFCAVKSQHPLTEELIKQGANVSYIGSVNGQPTSCIIEAITLTNTYLFDLIWDKFDKDLFKTNLRHFLYYFSKGCNLTGDNVVSCLKKVLTCKHGYLLLKAFRNNQRTSYLETIIETAAFKLNSNNVCEIISSLPIVHYDDVAYIFKKFNFNRELECLLKLYEYDCSKTCENYGPANALVDLMCYNKMKTAAYNLKDVLQLLRFCTPTSSFHIHFYRTFSGLATLEDPKLAKLITLYKLCDEVYSGRPIPSLQELSRNTVRNIIFKLNSKPYKCIGDLIIPDIIKDILYLKVPIYCF